MKTTAPAQRTNVWATAEMLAHAQPVQVLNKLGTHMNLPKNKGSILKARRWDVKALSVDGSGNPVTISEGIDPAGSDLVYTDVEVVLQQFGDFVPITDRVVDEYEDDVRQNATEQNGEQAGEIIELSCWGALRGGTNVDYANGTQRDAVNTVISDAMIARVERSLMAEKCKRERRILTGSPNYATTTVKASYFMVGHTDLLYDLEKLTGWRSADQYASQTTLMDEEAGSVGQLRVILSPTLTKWADAGGAAGAMVSETGTSADVYPLLAFGKNAFFHTNLKGASSIQSMIVQPNNPTNSNPLGLRGSIGWKARYVAGIANDAWLIRLEVAATKL